jgi:hypothetical protein
MGHNRATDMNSPAIVAAAAYSTTNIEQRRRRPPQIRRPVALLFSWRRASSRSC